MSVAVPIQYITKNTLQYFVRLVFHMQLWVRRISLVLILNFEVNV